jgi:hypothetical protein
MFLGSLISLLVETIEYLYKEALHTSYMGVRNALEGPGQPPPYIGQIAVATTPLPTTTSTAHAPHTHARSSSRRCA